MNLRTKLTEESQLNRYLLGGLVYFRIVDPDKEMADCAGMLEHANGTAAMKPTGDGRLSPEVFAFKKVELDEEFDAEEKIFGMTNESWDKLCNTNLLNEALGVIYEDHETKRK